jgi:hypothetical protein
MQQQFAHNFTGFYISPFEVSKGLRLGSTLRSPSLVTWAEQRGAFFLIGKFSRAKIWFFFP